MTRSAVIKRACVGLGIVLALLVGAVFLDRIPLSAARPPQGLRTIEEFKVWKQGQIEGQGTFENAGVTYTVLLAPAGRYLASGPSAYLFDEHGQFVDWTADMGDLFTAKNRFDLTSGHVKDIARAGP